MRVACSIDTYRRQKKCMKIILTVDEKDCTNIGALLDQHIGKPLLFEIVNDTNKQRELLLQITGEQRSKIFALIKDIAGYCGETKDNMRDQLTQMYCDEAEAEMFSLADCMADTASGFISWLIEFAFEQGCTLTDNPATGLNDVEAYLNICITKKRCCACGKDANVIKWDPGTQIALCDFHKARVQKVGKAAFTDEFHVFGTK